MTAPHAVPVALSELVGDVCTPFAAHLDNLHLLFTRSPARIHWALPHPRDVETWSPGIQLVESFSYFDNPEPRMGLPSWFAKIPSLSQATGIQRYELGTATTPAR